MNVQPALLTFNLVFYLKNTKEGMHTWRMWYKSKRQILKEKKMWWSSSMCHSHWCVTCMSPWWRPASPFPSVFLLPAPQHPPLLHPLLLLRVCFPVAFLTLILSFLFPFPNWNTLLTLSTHCLDLIHPLLFLNIYLVMIRMEVKISMKRRGVCRLAGCKFQNMNTLFLWY